MISNYNKRQQEGFSLIEVLVSLLIISAVSVVLTSISSTTLKSSKYFSNKMLAIWVAENRANELHLAFEHQWTFSLQEKIIEQGGNSWLTRVKVQKSTELLSRLSIQVSLVSTPSQTVYSLDTYIPSYQLFGGAQ